MAAIERCADAWAELHARIDRLRHNLITPLTIMQARAQRMERRLRGASGPPDDAQAWLQIELGHILSASRARRAAIERLPDFLRH